MDARVADLCEFVNRHRRVFVLTGAGCSTESGIPDYRYLNGDWKRPSPMSYQVFVSDSAARRRYWVRSLVGWPMIARARPGSAHRALARLEDAGRVELLLTQNVDGLHDAAGSRRTLDLHGRLDAVRCLSCAALSSRAAHQRELQRRNPGCRDRYAQLAPDGDADIEAFDFAAFDVPSCMRCGGVLKPDVVFFGESVPPERFVRARVALESSAAMLVVGSSLMVQSGFRFVRAAAAAGKPIAAVNLGRTRADDLFALKVQHAAGATLQELVEQIVRKDSVQEPGNDRNARRASRDCGHRLA